MNKGIDRRALLHGLGGAAALSATATALAACSSEAGQRNSTADNAKVTLPDYVRFDQVKPDMPGTEQGVPDAFLALPSPPVQGTQGKPASGGSFTAMAQLAFAPPPAVDRNPFWQSLNSRLGTELKLNGITEADYASKLATVLAGGDLPDCVQLPLSTPRLPDALRAQFQDLTDFLSGDAIREYPFLASIPPWAWPSAIYNGRIYGVPYPLAPVGAIMFSRRDLLRPRGITETVSDWTGFVELCRAVRDPGRNQWASAHPAGILSYTLEMLGSPGVTSWAQHNGEFTHRYEMDEYRKALDAVARLWTDGLFHPDSFSITGQQQQAYFAAGTTVLDYRANTWWLNYYTQYAPTIPTLELGDIPPAAFDGGDLGTKALGSGTFTITALKKASPDRIRELLRVMNWLAAPFGTEEYVFLRYGTKGQHYTEKDGSPELTEAGKSQVKVPTYYIANSPPVIYIAGRPQVTRQNYEYQSKVVPTGQKDAALGLVSDTAIKKNAQLTKVMTDVTNGVLQGRQTLADWDAAVKKWRADGGDAMRLEYEKAYDEVNG